MKRRLGRWPRTEKSCWLFLESGRRSFSPAAAAKPHAGQFGRDRWLPLRPLALLPAEFSTRSGRRSFLHRFPAKAVTGLTFSARPHRRSRRVKRIARHIEPAGRRAVVGTRSEINVFAIAVKRRISRHRSDRRSPASLCPFPSSKETRRKDGFVAVLYKRSICCPATS